MASDVNFFSHAINKMNQNIFSKFKMTFIALIAVCCLNSTDGIASESAYKPFVKGSFNQILQQNKDRPYIIAFWSVTCAYCMKELALFGQIMKEYPQVKLITITTDPFLEDESVQKLLKAKNLTGTETWVFADNFAERLYFDINPHWRGELPLTYFFDKNNAMVKHMGIVKEEELVKWLKEQSAIAE